MFNNFISLYEFKINEQFLAHTDRKGIKKSETLTEHSNLTKYYLLKLIKNKNIDNIIDNLITVIVDDSKEQNKIKDFMIELFYNAVYLHDLGKVNPYFQAKKMNNPLFDKYKNSSNKSRHSMNSAEQYIDFFINKLNSFNLSKVINTKIKFIIYNFSYQISKHHGRLSDFKTFRDNDKISVSYWEHLKKLNIPKFEFYILNKLLFSLIISSDYYATAEYMIDLKSKNFGLISQKQKEELIEKFESNKIVKNIRAFENKKLEFKDNDINKLRCEMFLESEKRIKENTQKNIFYLEAPTGSGKTLTSINLALKLLKDDKNLNKLFYIFPFNTLVEQTKKTFDDIFQDSIDIEVINSITPITNKKDDEQEQQDTEYDKAYLNRLFFHNPIILTTHVSLFNILFGTSREDNYPLWQLVNSVIIIDEIQSYNNNLWWYMIEFFQKYAKFLNIKIIIMSATLPKLDSLLKEDNKDSFFNLIEDRDYYFNNTLFKDRVRINFSLLEYDMKENFKDFEELKEKRIDNLLNIFDSEIITNKKILFEFIKKDSAREFFDILKERIKYSRNLNDFELYELTGDDNKAYRDFVISKTKKDKKIIIVATQVIEAGVDIDMDIGFKDISTLDSEEQFMGRVNRSCKKENSKVYFFYLDDETKIYKNDNRLEFNLRKIENQKILEDKNYPLFYKEVLNQIYKNGLRFENGVQTDIDSFKNSVSTLNYKDISKTMTLINSQNYTLFFPFKINIKQYKIKEFENIANDLLTDNFLDGKKVWNKFKELDEIQSFTEMKIKKSKINSLMQFFTFNIIKYGDNSPNFTFTELKKGIYYIDDYKDFITEDLKFNRKLFQERAKDNFY